MGRNLSSRTKRGHWALILLMIVAMGGWLPAEGQTGTGMGDPNPRSGIPLSRKVQGPRYFHHPARFFPLKTRTPGPTRYQNRQLSATPTAVFFRLEQKTVVPEPTIILKDTKGAPLTLWHGPNSKGHPSLFGDLPVSHP